MEIGKVGRIFLWGLVIFAFFLFWAGSCWKRGFEEAPERIEQKMEKQIDYM